MSTYFEQPVVIATPGELIVGGQDDVPAIVEMLVGDVTLDIPSAAAAAANGVSASGTIPNLDPANVDANHQQSVWKFLLQAQSWAAGDTVIIGNASAASAQVTVTARNMHTSVAFDPAARAYSYLAVRVDPYL